MKEERTEAQVDLLVKGGTVVTPDGAIPGWIGIQDGKIVAIGSNTGFPRAERIIDAGGNYVLPGIVDPEVHLPGGLQKGLTNETRAAVAGGVTTWGLQLTSVQLTNTPIEAPTPEDVRPFIEVFPTLKEQGDRYSMVDYFLTPIINRDYHAAEIPELAVKHGVTSFKSHLHLKMGAATWDIFPPAKRMGHHGFDDGMVYLAMRNIATIGTPGVYCIHCENWEIVRIIQQELMKEGRKDTAAWSDRSPAFCEAGHVRTYAYYAKITGCPIYIQHVTTPEAVEEIIKAKAEGVTIYGQTGPHYLSLTKDVWKSTIPLRDRDAIESCWQALRAGLIDCIGSDHVSMYRSREEMEVKGDVWATSGEFPRAEFLLPVMLSEGVNKGRISLARLVEVCCENPAKIFGLYPRKGVIALGSDADLVIVDLNKTRKVTREMVQSAAGWSIYEGWELKGWPTMTILRGNVMMEWPEGEPRARIVGKPLGQYLARKLVHELHPLD